VPKQSRGSIADTIKPMTFHPGRIQGRAVFLPLKSLYQDFVWETKDFKRGLGGWGLSFGLELITILLGKESLMLRVLRERKASWILRALLIGVAVSFVSWGGYSLIRERKQTYAAEVNGTVIDMKVYTDRFQAMVQQYRDAFGPQFSEKMIESLKLKETVLDHLISQALITQEAKRLGFYVSDEELREAIQSIPLFQVNGQFDSRNYERFLRYKRMTAEAFEETYRDELLVTKMTNLIRENGARVSEEELRTIYLFENERINLTFVKVSPENFKNRVKMTEAEAKEYYEKHKEELRTPAQVKIQYLLFRPSDVEGNVVVPPEEIKRYYESQKERFKIPKQVRAREILLKVGQDEPADKVEAKKKKAEEILQKAKATKDFVGLVKQYSEGENASKGGDTGWLMKGRVDSATEEALFSLKVGDLSGVVRRPAGFSIFKVEEVREERERSFEEMKDQIGQFLKREKAKSEASKRADDAFYALFRSRDLERYAQEKGIPLKTTDFFKEGDEVAELGRDPSVQASAFSLKVGEISPVLSAPPNFLILKLLEKKDSRIPSYEEAKEEVHKRLEALKADEVARQAAEDLLKQVQGGKSIRELAKEKGYPADETGFFNRTTTVLPKIGPVSEYMTLLASLTDQNPVPQSVLKTKEGYFVVRLLSTEAADPNKFEAVKKDLEKRVLSQKQEEFFKGWVEQLKARAKIHINKELKSS
jgi:peptidyl-prolyl cis-trans isomerase D